MEKSKRTPLFKPTLYQVSTGVPATVQITGYKSGTPTKRIVLNQKGLRVLSAQVTQHQKNKEIEYEVVRVNHLPKIDQVRIHANSMLYPGNYQIDLEFTGKKTSKITELAGKDLTDVVLRELLPSADEPALRAEAKIEIK